MSLIACQWHQLMNFLTIFPPLSSPVPLIVLTWSQQNILPLKPAKLPRWYYSLLHYKKFFNLCHYTEPFFMQWNCRGDLQSGRGGLYKHLKLLSLSQLTVQLHCEQHFVQNYRSLKCILLPISPQVTAWLMTGQGQHSLLISKCYESYWKQYQKYKLTFPQRRKWHHAHYMATVCKCLTDSQ